MTRNSVDNGFARDQVVLDIGAHYGMVTTRLASSLSRSSKIFAIEAHPSNYLVLKNNLELNHFTNVRALNIAVAGSTGSGTMSAYDGMSSHYELKKTEATPGASSQVHYYGLPEVMSMLNIDHADFVKVDIEGLELEVLQSSFPALANRIEKLDIEVHRYADLAPLLNLLAVNGYHVRADRAGIMGRSYRVFAEKLSSLQDAR